MGLFQAIFGGASVPTIQSNELKERIKQGKKPILVDVRQPEEFRAKHIDGALLIPLGELKTRAKELEQYKSKEIVVYCQSGGRSASACSMLQGMGFNVVNLAGGMMRW
jgi:rhodanese-related sulfurtransferase